MWQFAVALPWWGYALAFAVALLCAWLAYARVAVGLDRRQRAILVALRATTLLLIVVFLLRPVRYVQAEGVREAVVAILVDASRSMRIADDGTPRIERARALVEQLQPQFKTRFVTEVLSFGEALTRTEVTHLAADARRSDLSGALRAAADRYRGRPIAAMVVISDGGDTAEVEASVRPEGAVPVYTVGVGQAAVGRDLEVVSLTAGEPLLTSASIDLSVSVTSRGYGAGPIELRLTENGRPLETRRVVAAEEGAPVHQVFTVSPSPDRATVYAVEIPTQAGEIVAENNTRRVLVPPQGRRRHVLMVEGAPGFEHTFLKRALAQDDGLDVDSVVRKGQDHEGRDTFFIQAAAPRAAALATGFPRSRADLFRYDAIILGNIEADALSRDQLAMVDAFVATRGGGLLVLGARSFARAAFAGTPLDEALPVDLTDRRATATQDSGSLAANALALTVDGRAHPATRVAVETAENQARWASLPALAAINPMGAPRPGAQVLAVSGSATGQPLPLIVAQRYGAGRTLTFGGEASWRWRMQQPASNDTYELVWRQLTRWIAGGALDRLEVVPTSVLLPGTTENVSVLVRDDTFAGDAGATVTLRVQAPGGEERVLPATLTEARTGRYAAAVRFDEPGVYTIAADVRRGTDNVGTVSRDVLVGGVDVELAEPGLNEPVLRRVAEATGGRYVPAAELSTLPGAIAQQDTSRPPTEMRDLWHNGFSLAAIVLLLAGEWLMRRRVGLA